MHEGHLAVDHFMSAFFDEKGEEELKSLARQIPIFNIPVYNQKIYFGRFKDGGNSAFAPRGASIATVTPVFDSEGQLMLRITNTDGQLYGYLEVIKKIPHLHYVNGDEKN